MERDCYIITLLYVHDESLHVVLVYRAFATLTVFIVMQIQPVVVVLVDGYIYFSVFGRHLNTT